MTEITEDNREVHGSHKFKEGDWVRIRRDVTSVKYPEEMADMAEDVVRVLDAFPDAASVLLVVDDATGVFKPDSIAVPYYNCKIHPVFPWNEAFSQVGEHPDSENGYGYLTFYEFELERYEDAQQN